jgi:hypothetical protein
MEKLKIGLVLLIAGAVAGLVLLFKSGSKKDLDIHEKMAQVRASRGLKKYVEPEISEKNESENQIGAE